MTYRITVHGTPLRVAVAVEDLHFRATSPDWPGYDGTGSTPESAVRRLAGQLEIAADRAIYTARARDRASFGPDVRLNA